MGIRYIVDGGAITSLGHDLPRTIASLRSGLDMFGEIPFAGSSHQFLRAAPVAGYGEGLDGIARYEALAVRALAPILSRIPVNQRSWIRLIVGLPRPDRPGVPTDLELHLRHQLAHRFGLDHSQIRCISTGRTSVFRGLVAAESIVDPSEHVIVGGVDVLCDPRSLARLSAAQKLKEEWDGFIPGDAAAFVRTTLNPSLGFWGRPAAQIKGATQTTDPADATKDNPRIGMGLSKAFAQAADRAGIKESAVDLRINDLNGERTWFEDDAMATTRYFRTARDEPLELWHLGSYFGETGAAAGALELMWASAALELGFHSSQCAMLSCSEENDRAAIIVLPPRPSTENIERFGEVSLIGPVTHHVPVIENIQQADPGIRLESVDDTARKLAQANFDELASLLLIRDAHHSQPHAGWLDIEGFEQRALAHLDALAWSPQTSAALAFGLLDSGDLDPEEYAALTLVYGTRSVGENLPQQLLELARSDDESGQMVTTHLGLSQSPVCTRVLTHLAHPDNDAQQIERALRALHLSGKFEAQTIDAVASAGRYELLPTLFELCAAAGDHQLAQRLIGYHQSKPPKLSPPQAIGYVALASNNTAPPLFTWRQYLNEAPILAALFCLRSGAALSSMLTSALSSEISSEQALALGWSGETDAVHTLLSTLQLDDEELAESSAQALNLILGADLYEEVELPEDDPHAEVFELESTVDPVTACRLTLDPAAWLKAYEQLGSPKGSRLRHGAKWHKTSSLAHLQRPEPDYNERLWACWEYTIVTGRGFPLHPKQFVGTQRKQLASCPSNAR